MQIRWIAVYIHQWWYITFFCLDGHLFMSEAGRVLMASLEFM